MRAISDLPELDFASDAYTKAPFETLAEYAQNWKLARSVRGVEILDYDLCRKAIIDRRLGTGHPKLMDVLGLPEGRPLDYKRNSISFHNRGERRRQLRRPVTGIMSPTGVENFREEIREIVRRVVDAIPADKPIDLIPVLCDVIPSAVYCNWIGAPFEKAGFVAQASHRVQQVHTRNPDLTDDIIHAFEELIDFVDHHIAIRRAAPADDLLSDLLQSEAAGFLSADDLRNWVIKMAEANTDNSSHQIAIAVIELASRPEVWARLHSDPTLAPAAIKEVMRIHPRTISTSREAMEDMVVADTHIPKGTPVFANIGATHWNERYYHTPEVFDLNRTDEPPHLNFGGGIFSCIGRYFVTIEIEETVAYLAQKYPELSIEKSEFSHSAMFTSVTDLIACLR